MSSPSIKSRHELNCFRPGFGGVELPLGKDSSVQSSVELLLALSSMIQWCSLVPALLLLLVVVAGSVLLFCLATRIGLLVSTELESVESESSDWRRGELKNPRERLFLSLLEPKENVSERMGRFERFPLKDISSVSLSASVVLAQRVIFVVAMAVLFRQLFFNSFGGSRSALDATSVVSGKQDFPFTVCFTINLPPFDTTEDPPLQPTTFRLVVGRILTGKVCKSDASSTLQRCPRLASESMALGLGNVGKPPSENSSQSAGRGCAIGKRALGLPLHGCCCTLVLMVFVLLAKMSALVSPGALCQLPAGGVANMHTKFAQQTDPKHVRKQIEI